MWLGRYYYNLLMELIQNAFIKEMDDNLSGVAQ